MSDEYHGPERRAVTRHEVADMVAEEMDRCIDGLSTKLINHINARITEVKVHVSTATEKIKQDLSKSVDEAIQAHVEEAFPPGPLHLHKGQHQKHIDAAANLKRIIQDLQLWAIRGILLFMAGLLFLGAQSWLARELAK